MLPPCVCLSDVLLQIQRRRHGALVILISDLPMVSVDWPDIVRHNSIEPDKGKATRSLGTAEALCIILATAFVPAGLGQLFVSHARSV